MWSFLHNPRNFTSWLTYAQSTSHSNTFIGPWSLYWVNIKQYQIYNTYSHYGQRKLLYVQLQPWSEHQILCYSSLCRLLIYWRAGAYEKGDWFFVFFFFSGDRFEVVFKDFTSLIVLTFRCFLFFLFLFFIFLSYVCLYINLFYYCILSFGYIRLFLFFLLNFHSIKVSVVTW